MIVMFYSSPCFLAGAPIMGNAMQTSHAALRYEHLHPPVLSWRRNSVGPKRQGRSNRDLHSHAHTKCTARVMHPLPSVSHLPLRVTSHVLPPLSVREDKQGRREK